MEFPNQRLQSMQDGLYLYSRLLCNKSPNMPYSPTVFMLKLPCTDYSIPMVSSSLGHPSCGMRLGRSSAQLHACISLFYGYLYRCNLGSCLRVFLCSTTNTPTGDSDISSSHCKQESRTPHALRSSNTALDLEPQGRSLVDPHIP